MLQQAVKRTQWVVAVLATGFVDFIHHHHGVGVLTVHQGFKHLAGACTLPLA